MSTHIEAREGYTIREASRLSGLPESTLRYYETIGLIEPINRDASSKHRVYSEDNLNIIVAVACLSATGMSIEDMRTYLQNRNRGVDAADEQIDLLQTQKHRLVQEATFLKLQQHYVDIKIAYWQTIAAGDVAQVKKLSAEAGIIAASLKLPRE
jgi:DNA-binding transcriptional MerR regulator